MRKVWIAFFLAVMSLSSSAQIRTIYYNSKWEISSKEAASYYRTCQLGYGLKNCFFTGKLNDYLMDGKLIMSGAYSEVGLKTGEFIFYYPSGQIQAQGTFENGLRSGVWKYFFKNGKLEREVKFPFQEKYKPTKDDFEAISVYDSAGTPLLMDGTGDWHYEYEWYNTADRYIIDGKFKRGKKEGFWTCSLSSGQLLYREFFKNNIFKEGFVTDGIKREELEEPVNNKFMLPYKFEVNESFVYQPGITKKDYSFLSFLPAEEEKTPIKSTIDSAYRNVPEDEKVFIAVEQPAEYPGGLPALMKFVSKNLKYPEMAKRMGIEGKVWVSFIVETDGSISTIKITRGVNADLDREAIRIVSLFPRWSPGMQNGRTVKSQFVIPIPFKLDR
jgi:TonB family protein